MTTEEIIKTLNQLKATEISESDTGLGDTPEKPATDPKRSILKKLSVWNVEQSLNNYQLNIWIVMASHRRHILKDMVSCSRQDYFSRVEIVWGKVKWW